MTTKNSQKKQAGKGSEEARSRLLTLISGQKGPLPLDNDQRLKPRSSPPRISQARRHPRRKKRPPEHT
jgi:hypothetical protein